METEIVDQQHDQNDVVEFELTEEPARAANATVNYVTIGHVQNMNTATKLEQIGSNSLHLDIQGNLANSKSTNYTTNYIKIDEATNSAMENQNPQAANTTPVDEAQKSQLASQNCSQFYNCEENFAPHINIAPNVNIAPNTEEATSSIKQNPTTMEDETTSSAKQNQNFMGRIANQIRYKIKGTILKRRLQQFYKEVTLPCVTWLDKGQDKIMSNYYTKLQLDSSKTTITIDQIFDKIGDKKPQTILVEGQPGYGKSTLATKLIYDWAVQEKYIKHFKLAFLLPLRELRKRSIGQAMTNIANLCGFNNSCLRNIIQDNISNILLIVDGLDELAVTDRMPILKLLYKQEYAQMTVIVTCRTGSFTPDRDELSELFGGISRKKVFYDKSIEVLGIAIENRKKFLLNFISNEYAKHIFTQIEKLTEPVKEMFKSPLFLILLAFIASNKSDVTALTTKTDLFKRLFNCIINRSLKTQEISEYNLFHLDSTLNKTQKTIQQYGKRGLDQLVNHKMQFECDELTKQIYQLGFLTKNKQISVFHSISHYEAFHRSILEFAAAFSLWINFKQNPSSTNPFHHIQSIYPQLDKTSLVVPFLIGLLQGEACHFFNQFKCYAHLFSANEEIFWSLLTECPTNSMWNKLLKSIIPFIPTTINHTWSPLISMKLPDFFDNLIQVGIENNQIERIIVYIAPSSLRLPNNIPNLMISQHPFRVHNQKLINSYRGIRCKNFHLTLHEHDDLNILNLFSLIRAKSYTLRQNDDGKLSKLMYEHIDDDVVKQLQLNHLYAVRYNPILKDLIHILLKRNQVHHLHMLRCYKFMQLADYYEILSAASISPRLHSLELEWGPSDNELVIDLFDLTQGGKKKYNHLSFTNCQIVSKYELQDKNCIHSLNINYDEIIKLGQCSDGLSAIAPEVFKCNSSVIQQLSPLWMGYTSLKELNLRLKNNIEDWSFLSNCKNIKKLTISFNICYKYSLDIMNKFIKYVQQLPIEQLGIISDIPNSVWEKLCKHIASSLPWMNKSHPIHTLKLSFFRMINDEDETICSVKLDFLECLKLGYLKTIDLSYNQHLNWHSLMRSSIIDYSLFRITHSFADDEYSGFKHKFCIKLKE